MRVIIVTGIFSVLPFLVAVTAWPVAEAQVLGENRYAPVTPAEVWRAVANELRTRGFIPEQLEHPEELELPVAVPARIGRKLEVSSVCWDADAECMRFRLECLPAGSCVRFLAYVKDGIELGSHANAPSCGIGSTRPLRTAAQRSAPTVRPGQRATALLAASGLRMTATVTCLDHGAPGEIVRVRGQEGRIFRARVTGKALLEKLPE